MNKAEYEAAIESAKFAIINEPISVFERLMIARALLAAHEVVKALRAIYALNDAINEALRELDQGKA